MLKEKLKEIFVNEDDLSGETVTAFCMVGNIRAFAIQNRCITFQEKWSVAFNRPLSVESSLPQKIGGTLLKPI